MKLSNQNSKSIRRLRSIIKTQRNRKARKENSQELKQANQFFQQKEDLQSKNVSDLKDICRDEGFRGWSKLRKNELVEFIIENRS